LRPLKRKAAQHSGIYARKSSCSAVPATSVTNENGKLLVKIREKSLYFHG